MGINGLLVLLDASFESATSKISHDYTSSQSNLPINQIIKKRLKTIFLFVRVGGRRDQNTNLAIACK